MFVLIESVRNGCESDCLLGYPIFVSSSREKLEEKKIELENIELVNIDICRKFIEDHREWIKTKQSLSFENYTHANKKFLYELRKKYKEKYNINPELLQVYGYSESIYSIDEVEEL